MSRLISRSPFHTIPFFLAFGLALLLAPGARAQAYGQDSDGLDYFQTVAAETSFDFRGELALPAGFLDYGAPRFAGRVPFQGVPLGRYEGKESGNADCIMARRGTTVPGTQYPSRGSARIELVALSLRSSQPIKVRVGRKTQLWDVKLALSPSRPSSGKMEIVRTSARGGTFDSEFLVVPILTFVRRGDGAERTLDLGKGKLAPATEKALTLQASKVPWAAISPSDVVVAGSNFNPGVLDNARIKIFHDNHNKHTVFLAKQFRVNPREPLGGR